MNTSTSLDARSLAHRLTTVGHALHHRLFAQLRDSGIHPKTLFLLSAVDGRVDAPWIAARLARGGKRIDSLVAEGWIARGDTGWTLTDEGRAVLARVDAARAALLADVPAEELEHLTTALDAVSAALGLDEADDDSRLPVEPAVPGAGRGFGPVGRGFGPGMRGFGPRFGADPQPFGPREHGERDGRGFAHGDRGFAHGDAGRGAHGRHGSAHGETGHEDAGHGHLGTADRGEHDRAGRGRGCAPRRDGSGHEHGHHRGHGHHDRRSAQRAFERGFDAGFRRGREASASGDAASGDTSPSA
ncbi:hypothetical protein AB0230_14995 [Microbacterium sp. NPDC089190]|uniref:hypothetical protein n=1 Tax=Microbacterium sp. NPDC089190 TaxID=3155063 RepID=UPI00344DF098